MSTNRVPELVAARATLLRTVRRFFDERGYLEVDTPALARSLIPEPAIDVFVTEAHHRATPLYLAPSPERWMKRLLAAGCAAIYQVSRAFRNLEESGPWHAGEFSMLEWYSTGEDWIAARRTTTDLLRETVAALGPWRTGGGVDAAADHALEPEVHTVAELCERALGSPLVSLPLAELQAIASRLDAAWSPDDDWERLFHRLFLAHVEPSLPADRPVFVTDYPSGVPTLARAIPDRAVAERWELYLGGVEIANCYQEEVDPQRLREVIGAEAERVRSHRVTSHHATSHSPTVSPPPIASPAPPRVDWGLPDRFGGSRPCSGVALGIDRLLALLLGTDGLTAVAYCDTTN